MAAAFNKEIWRSITHSWGRFIAIAIIAGLGCGFFAGLLMSSVDMNASADAFYDGTNASDIYVTGTLGIDDAQVDAIAHVDGVKAVEPVRSGDAYVVHEGAKYVMRFSSLDMRAAQASDCSDGMTAQSADDSYINRPVLVEGSWPAPGQCVVAADAVLDEPIEVGDVIEAVEEDADDSILATTSYVVSGLVRSPYYVMTSNFGSTELGSGEIDSYVFVYAEDFADGVPYTGAFVTVDGAASELYPSDGYDHVVDEVLARLNALAPSLSVQRLASVRSDAQAELDEARATYERERDDAMAQLADAERELSDARKQLDAAAVTLSSNRSELAAAQEELSAAQSELEQGKVEIDERRAELDEGWRAYDAGVLALDEQRTSALERLDAAQSQVDLITDPEQRAHAQAALDAERASALVQLDVAQAQLDQSRARLEEGGAALDAAVIQYEQGRAQVQAGWRTLGAGQAQLAAGYEDYERGRAQYESGVSTYERNRADALAQLDEAKVQIDDAQADINAIEAPEFYVLDRSKNVGMAGHEADASRIDQIAHVFPLIFFLVAALVSLTTMTRMIDEERMLIGTYKALGYGNGRIMSKYLIYAFVASGVGSALGILLFAQVLPQIIMRSYAIIYAIPVFASPVDAPIALVAFVLSVGITLVATWAAVASTLRERPALLMLPRAPKPGKRILLERMGPLWRRLSFSWKVTARNLFRYKRRFFMAVIGIAGCTALLLTGLGLYNGINDIIEKQFGEIQHFNLEIQSSDSQDATDATHVQSLLDDAAIVTDTMHIASENALVAASDGDKDVGATIIVPEDEEAFPDFYTLRERIGHAPLALSEEGAVITEKLASELGVGVGDTVELYEQSAVGERSGSAHEVQVSGVAEFYTGQRVFMSPSCYERVMGQACSFDNLICMAPGTSAERTALANQILEVGGVEVVSYYDEIIETYRTMLRTVNAVVVILIVAAALLAFVVLYNLTNINITERMREIATLKVLGFTPRETNSYIFRETLILTVIGALAGLLLGVWMEGFVVVTAEVDQMMFGRDIHVASFAVAFVLTILFSLVVSLFMRPKLKAIDMVESLKSVD